MTSISSVLAAFAIIFIDLLGRAGLDKVLALSGGPAMVALWAQLQSVMDMVSGVATSGVLQGLTVLIAQIRDERDERNLLQSSLKLSLGTSLALALVVVLASPALAAWLTQGRIEPVLFLLAAWGGCLAVIPATLGAYWLGKHRQQNMLILALIGGTVWFLVATGAWQGLSLHGLMLVQSGALLIIGIVIWRVIRKLSRAGAGLPDTGQYFSKLLKFLPVGLAIGIMSPVSMLLIRGLLSGMLSWDEVGFIQALWRTSDWVTSTAAGVLSLVFLPRLSSTYGTARFNKELMRAGFIVLIPAACLLLMIYVNQRVILSTLYDARFAVSDQAAALFMLGSWLRVASWVFMFGLFAAHRTRLLVAGEVLSLPLLVLMLWMFADGMTLERATLIYLSSYVVYLGFNAIALRYSSASAIIDKAAVASRPS